MYWHEKLFKYWLKILFPSFNVSKQILKKKINWSFFTQMIYNKKFSWISYFTRQQNSKKILL